MINKKKEGGFYASKVRLFLNAQVAAPGGSSHLLNPNRNFKDY